MPTLRQEVEKLRKDAVDRASTAGRKSAYSEIMWCVERLDAMLSLPEAQKCDEPLTFQKRTPKPNMDRYDAEQSEKCEHCGGSGKRDIPMVSGPTIRQDCSRCKGKGVKDA